MDKYIQGLYQALPEDVEKYVENQESRQKIILTGFIQNLGHFVSDEVTAMQSLIENRSVATLDNYWIGPHNFLILEELFPEIDFELMFKSGDVSLALFKAILDNNRFAYRLTNKGDIQESLCKRIYFHALKKCTKQFLQQINESKRYFPRIWITLRSNCRYWLSQAEGYAKIINALLEKYPDSCFIFDGLQREIPVMQNILKLAQSEVITYNALQCEIFETIVWTHNIDFFIAPFGAGTIFTSIANKKGVIYGHKEWIAEWAKSEPFCINRRENPLLSIPVAGDSVGLDAVFTGNYEVDWKDIYNAILGIINTLYEEGLNVHS